MAVKAPGQLADLTLAGVAAVQSREGSQDGLQPMRFMLSSELYEFQAEKPPTMDFEP